MTRPMSRLRTGIRQRRYHRAFRIAESTWDDERCQRLARRFDDVIVELKHSKRLPPTPEPAGPPVDDKALAQAITDLWRAQRKLDEERTEGSARSRQAGRFLRASRQALTDAGIQLRDHDGDAYHPGLPMEVVTFTEGAVESETVLETVRPSIDLAGRRIQVARVIVATPAPSTSRQGITHA